MKKYRSANVFQFSSLKLILTLSWMLEFANVTWYHGSYGQVLPHVKSLESACVWVPADRGAERCCWVCAFLKYLAFSESEAEEAGGDEGGETPAEEAAAVEAPLEAADGSEVAEAALVEAEAVSVETVKEPSGADLEAALAEAMEEALVEGAPASAESDGMAPHARAVPEDRLGSPDTGSSEEEG